MNTAIEIGVLILFILKLKFWSLLNELVANRFQPGRMNYYNPSWQFNLNFSFYFKVDYILTLQVPFTKVVIVIIVMLNPLSISYEETEAKTDRLFKTNKMSKNSAAQLRKHKKC
jgi:hypothetical protein